MFGNRNFKKITLAIMAYTFIFILLSLIFATIYYYTDAIAYQGNLGWKVGFFDSLYFSMISLFTIGYGDIYPVEGMSKNLVMLQGYLGIVLSSVFSSFLVFYILKRPSNVVVSDKILLSKRTDLTDDESYFLSVRVGNKGAHITNSQGNIDFFYYQDDRKILLYSTKREYPVIEDIWVFNININKENEYFYKKLKEIYNDEDRELIVKFSLTGFDSVNGNPLFAVKNYNQNHIEFGKRFEDMTYNNDRSKTLNWKNFNSIEEVEEGEIEDFFNLDNKED